MQLNTKKVNDKMVVYLEGRLDVSLSMEIEHAVNGLIDSGEKHLIFNLEKVEYLSSSGLRIFIAAMRKLKDLDGTLKLTNLKPSVRKIFKIVELEDLFEIYDTEEDALNS